VGEKGETILSRIEGTLNPAAASIANFAPSPQFDRVS
jgi:hypothetical protein